MTEPEADKPLIAPKKRFRWLKYFLTVLGILLLLGYLFIFFGFNYFGERFLRNFLQEKISQASHGLYRADFRKMNFNIITGKVVVDSFELIPDTLLYQKRKSQGKLSHSLYRVSIASLTIDRLHAMQIYTQKRINLKQLIVANPVISIVGFPDEKTAQKNRWRVIYEDIYPAISRVFNDFHVDSVLLQRGIFRTSFQKKTGKRTIGEYEFSSILRDVSVNPFSYYNKERVFYSRDIDLVIYDFEYALADSLYILQAKEAGFSLTNSRLYGKQLTLKPNFKRIRTYTSNQGDFFELQLPFFSIDGINMYRALTDKKVEVEKVALGDFSMKMFRNTYSDDTLKLKKKKKKMTVAGLYTVVAGVLKTIAIDTISLSNASFEYYSGYNHRYPEMKIDHVELDLFDFFLDSAAWKNKKKILYSQDIELELKGFNLKLRDQIHTLRAQRLYFSTRRNIIQLQDGLLSPDMRKNELLASGQVNTIFFKLPNLTFSHIDLKLFFNRRIVVFNTLEVTEPDLKIVRFRPPKNKDPRFRRAQDFFNEENEDVVYNLLKKYIHSIRGDAIRIKNGYGQMARSQDGVEKKTASASFDLVMEQFLIDSVHGLNQQGYFYSRDFDLDLHSVLLEPPDNLQKIHIGRLHISTVDSLIEAWNIHLIKTGNSVPSAAQSQKHPPLSVDFSLRKLFLTGLNHKKLFLEKILKANQIVLENPILKLKTESRETSEIQPDDAPLHPSVDPIRYFEIGRLLVKNGNFSYDGQEDRKASDFVLKDIDFALVNAAIRLPKKKSHDGLIRFDSLQLSVLPFRATLSDSLYLLEASSLAVNSYPAMIVAFGLKITPLKPINQLPANAKLFTVNIPEFHIMGFYFDKAIFDNEWEFKRIVAKDPSVFVEIKRDPSKPVKSVWDSGNFSIKLPPFMKSLKIPSLKINNASVGVTVLQNDSIRSFSLEKIFIHVNRFLVDSTTRTHPGNTPLFNAEDISLSAPGFSGITRDSMYTYGFTGFGFSTKTQKVYIDSVTVVPNYSRNDFSRKLGYQADRLVVSIPRIDLEKVDFRELLTNRHLTAKSVRLDKLNFESYRDKRVPFPLWQRPLLPQQMFRKIPYILNIDSVFVTNGFAAYEEQTGEEPGRVFFDRMNVILTGIHHKTDFFNLHGTAWLMGKAPVVSAFHFMMNHPRDSTIIKADIGPMDLRDINPMLTRLMPASIYRGNLTHADIGPIYMNDSLALGRMVMYYDDLAIRLEPTLSGTWPMIKTFALNELINLLLPESNPAEDKKSRTGLIYFERDRTKGFFNFVWKSSLSGIKSNVGFNTKTQKEMIKAMKKKKK